MERRWTPRDGPQAKSELMQQSNVFCRLFADIACSMLGYYQHKQCPVNRFTSRSLG